MIAVTDTFICTSCKKIVDVSVGKYGKTYPKEEVLNKKHGRKTKKYLNFYHCSVHNSGTELIEWDVNKKPCPLCDGIMEPDDNGEEIFWD